MGRWPRLGRRRRFPMPEVRAPRPRQPFIIMNPASGGGKVEQFDLAERARALGAEVYLLDPLSPKIDIAEVARAAVRDGADLLGMASGDGGQGLVAGVAAESDVPFMVVAAGTRNHLARDLGLDCKDPGSALDALCDGVDVRVDLGYIGDRAFVNNCAFGAYAALIDDPDYRYAKVATVLRALPDLLQGDGIEPVSVAAAGRDIDNPQAVLISNNPYGTDDVAGLGRRARLDRGVLKVISLSVEGPLEAAALLTGRSPDGLDSVTAQEVAVNSLESPLRVGVDGELLAIESPVTITIRPRSLRVRLPRNRPGLAVAHPLARLLPWRRLDR